MATLCLVIGGASCKRQLAAQVKAVAGGSCLSKDSCMHNTCSIGTVILFYLVVLCFVPNGSTCRGNAMFPYG